MSAGKEAHNSITKAGFTVALSPNQTSSPKTVYPDKVKSMYIPAGSHVSESVSKYCCTILWSFIFQSSLQTNLFGLTVIPAKAGIPFFNQVHTGCLPQAGFFFGQTKKNNTNFSYYWMDNTTPRSKKSGSLTSSSFLLPVHFWAFFSIAQRRGSVAEACQWKWYCCFFWSHGFAYRLVLNSEVISVTMPVTIDGVVKIR